MSLEFFQSFLTDLRPYLKGMDALTVKLILVSAIFIVGIWYVSLAYFSGPPWDTDRQILWTVKKIAIRILPLALLTLVYFLFGKTLAMFFLLLFAFATVIFFILIALDKFKKKKDPADERIERLEKLIKESEAFRKEIESKKCVSHAKAQRRKEQEGK